MATWSDLEREEPEFATRARRLLESGRHRTLATLRSDGAPRISGIECEIVDGRLRFGSMSGSVKSADLRRDPRFALHGPTVDPIEGRESEWPGEVKIAGLARHRGPMGGVDRVDGDRFEIDITEVVITRLDEAATRLIVESWRPGNGIRRIERT